MNIIVLQNSLAQAEALAQIEPQQNAEVETLRGALAQAEKELLASLTVADVLQAYRGRAGCGCGCRGNYYTPPENRAEAETDARRPLDEKEVSATSVKNILTWIRSADKVEVGRDLAYISVENDARAWRVYLTAAALQRFGAAQQAT